MESLTDKFSLFLHKYILGILFFTSGIIILWNGSLLLKFIALFPTGIGVFLMSLKTIEFDEQFIYIGRKKFTYDQIETLSGLEINQLIFPCLIIKTGNKKRRYYTDMGQSGLLRIVISLFIPKLDPLNKLKNFIQIYERQKSNT